MLALIEGEFVDKKKIIDRSEYMDMLAIAESTPGPIAINSATFIGFKYGGVLGSLFSTIAVCIPSFVILYVISLFFDKFLELTYVAYAFKGIQVCVIYLIASAGIRFLKSMDKNWLSVTILIVVLALFIAFSVCSINFSSIFYIIICGVLGIMVYVISLLRKKGEKKL